MWSLPAARKKICQPISEQREWSRLTISGTVACRASLASFQGMAGQGSSGNVIAALCSFFIPGLGQLLQGRLLTAIIHFVLASLLWFVLLGWLVHLWSILDAAMFKPR